MDMDKPHHVNKHSSNLGIRCLDKISVIKTSVSNFLILLSKDIF